MASSSTPPDPLLYDPLQIAVAVKSASAASAFSVVSTVAGTAESFMDSAERRQERGECFPAGATIVVKGKGVMRMADLSYGDMVRSLGVAPPALLSCRMLPMRTAPGQGQTKGWR